MQHSPFSHEPEAHSLAYTITCISKTSPKPHTFNWKNGPNLFNWITKVVWI